MFFSALRALVGARLLEFRREPSALYFVVLAPIALLSILHFSIQVLNKSEEKVQVGVSEELWQSPILLSPQASLVSELQDQASWGEFLQAQSFPYLEFIVAPTLELDTALKAGDLAFVVALSSAGSGWQVRFMPSQGGATAHEKVFHSPRWLAQAFHGQVQNSLGRVAWLDLQWQEMGRDGEDSLSALFYLFMGILLISLLGTSIFGVGMTIVTHRREGLLKRFLITPMPPLAYILSHVTARQLIMLLEVLIIGGFGLWVMKLSFSGSWLLFLWLCLLGTMNFTFLAVLLASRTTQSSFYSGLARGVVLVMIVLGGVFYPVTDLPFGLASLSYYLLPTVPLGQALRDVAFLGVGFYDVLPEMGLLIIQGVVFAALSHVCFLWYAR